MATQRSQNVVANKKSPFFLKQLASVAFKGGVKWWGRGIAIFVILWVLFPDPLPGPLDDIMVLVGGSVVAYVVPQKEQEDPE